jgi:hypothetical protein
VKRPESTFDITGVPISHLLTHLPFQHHSTPNATFSVDHHSQFYHATHFDFFESDGHQARSDLYGGAIPRHRLRVCIQPFRQFDNSVACKWPNDTTDWTHASRKTLPHGVPKGDSWAIKLESPDRDENDTEHITLLKRGKQFLQLDDEMRGTVASIPDERDGDHNPDDMVYCMSIQPQIPGRLGLVVPRTFVTPGSDGTVVATIVEEQDVTGKEEGESWKSPWSILSIGTDLDKETQKAPPVKAGETPRLTHTFYYY